MADGLNKVFLLGNLGADPELRVTPSGQSVLRIRLATSSSYLDKNRVRKERVEWHGVTVWGKRAEALSRFLEKGSRICVEGELRTSSYQAADGSGTRYRTEINAFNIILAGGGRRSGSGSDSSDSHTNSSDRFEQGEDESYEDDIPF